MSDLDLAEYILSLEAPYTLEKLAILKGGRVPIISWSYAWRKPVIDHDELHFTKVVCQVDAFTGEITGSIMVYSDYLRRGKKDFNAWNSIEAIKGYVRNRKENIHGLLSQIDGIPAH